MPTIDFSKLRHDFPMLKQTMHGHPLVYFDSTATTQKPNSVIDAEANFYREHYGTIHRAVYDLALNATHQYQQVRKRISHFLHANKEEEIIFTKGTTESINLVAYSFGKAFVRPGDEILIGETEHHANIVPWQLMCEERGATIKVIPVDDAGDLDLEAYKKLLTEKTKMVAVAHVVNSIGTVNPLREIIAWAHDAGAKILVDGAQGAPHLPVDVIALDCDFYAFSGHKIYGPTGVGVLYGKEALLEAMPPYQSGGDMIDTVTFEKTTYNVLPFKFEAGTPMIAQVIGLGAAIDYVEGVGLDNINQQETKLLHHATKQLQQIEGVRIIGNAKDKASIISFAVDGVHPLDIGTLLDLRGIAVRTGHHCAQPTLRRFGLTATTRASFALYNTIDEIDYFAETLPQILKKLLQ